MEEGLTIVFGPRCVDSKRIYEYEVLHELGSNRRQLETAKR
jgi:hypothetical protein